MNWRIGILTTLWRRHDLEKVVLRYYSRLKVDGVKLVGVAVGSEGTASRRIALDAGWNYVEAPNDPLGAKHNAGMEAFKDLDVEGVVVIGSDDFLTPQYFAWLRGHIETGAHCFSLRGCHFYNAQDGRLLHAPRFTPGAGRWFSRRTLEAHKWRLWPDNRRTHLDGSIDEIARQNGPWRFMHSGDEGVVLLDVKGAGANMWDFGNVTERAAGRGSFVPDVDAFFDEHFPGLRANIDTTASLTAHDHG